MEMSSDVRVVNNFFEPQCAKDLMAYMDNLELKNIMEDKGGRKVVINLDDPFLNKIVAKYQDKVINYFNDGFNTLSGYICSIYREGVGMAMHSDAQPVPEMGALFYLNDDYEGGELKIESDEEYIYKPKALDMVYMSSEPLHGVLPVTKGTRYFFTISLIKENNEANK